MAIRRGASPGADRLVVHIGADKWREYLAILSRSNARSSHAYLLRAQGRRNSGLVPAVVSNARKCEGELVLSDGTVRGSLYFE